MRLVSKFLLLAAFTVPTFADVLGFYAGDIDVTNPGAYANGTTASVGGTPTGASIYQAFVVPTGGWTVTGLFSNNLMSFTPTSAYWEIRSGVSAGNGGTLLHSGTVTAPASQPRDGPPSGIRSRPYPCPVFRWLSRPARTG